MRASFIKIVIALRIFITLAIVVSAVPAQAQPLERLLVSLNFGAVSVEGQSEFGTTVSVFYRFNSMVALGGEILGHRWLPPELPNVDTGPFEIDYKNPRGRSTTFALTLRMDAPQVWRLVPYAVVGGGVGHVKRTYTETYLSNGPPLSPSIVSESDFGPQAMGGGGLSLMVIRNGSIDLDVRYLYSQKQPDSSAVRIGGGVSYRF